MATLSGYYGRTVFRDEKTGFTVFLLKTADGKNITCSGVIPPIAVCTPLTLKGESGVSPKYPDVFSISSIKAFSSDRAADISYMISVSDGDISPKDADAAAAAMAPQNVFDAVLSCEGARDFAALSGLSSEQAGKVFDKTIRAARFRELMEAVISAGGQYSDALRIFDRYEDSSLSALRKSPYTVCGYLGLRFELADSLYLKTFGGSPLSDTRAAGMLYFAVDAVLSQGSTYARVWEIAATVRYLQKPLDAPEISPYMVLSFLFETERYSVDGDRIYLKEVKEQEETFVRNLERLSNSAKESSFNELLVQDVISDSAFALSDSQKYVFNSLKCSGVKIITGGPGRGKTTVINLLIEYLKRKGEEENIIMMAPTGCAAQKMAEKAGMGASTIHSALGVRPFDGLLNPMFTSDSPLPYRYFIIDEYSMADLEISSLLFSAIPNGATVIIVGDPDQLPSVGAGNVLNDLIDSGCFEVYRLTDIYRQSADSVIIDNAELVKSGRTDMMPGPDFEIHTFATSDAAVNGCLDFIKASDIKDMQVLCPLKKHGCGTRHMNNVIQSLSDHIGQTGKVYGAHTFYEGDDVITVRNQKDKGYFNGEPGTVKYIDSDGMLIKFRNGDEIYIRNSELGEVLPSKALTIHKSQGNEYDNVVMLLTEEASLMMSRQILYTGLTRAKKKVNLFIQAGCIDSIRTDRRRNSRLADILSGRLLV